MFGAVQASSPVRVQLDSRSSSADAFDAFLGGLGRVFVGLVLFIWRAPALALVAAFTLLTVWAVAVGYWLAALLAVLALALVGGLVAWRRPDTLRSAGSVFVGQWLRVTVYRRRWETACVAARTVVRLGNSVHVPGLVRHKHTQGLDVLTVRSAPGQTLAEWQAASPSLASTFSAHSVTAREGSRPGWVVLDVLRRDPLGSERVAPNPARNGTGLVELGRDEYGHPVTLDPYKTPHMGLQGASRSGKSSASYTLLAAFAHRLDVVVCGIDPSGLLLGAFENGPGNAFIATGTSEEALKRAAHALNRLVGFMDERIGDLRAAGLDKISRYSPALPVVWVVLEEYPGLLSAARALDAATGAKGAKGADRIAPQLERAVGRLVKEGAKVGFCVLVIAQRMSADALATDDRANLAVRCTLRVDNGDAVAMLHDGIPRAGLDAVRQFKPGVGIIEAPGAPLRRVRMHFTDYATYRRRVADGLATPGHLRLASTSVVVGHTTTAPAAVASDADTAALPVIVPSVVVPV